MKTLIPEKPSSELKEILSEDTCVDLIVAYEEKRTKINGRTISDISLVFKLLTKWTTTEKVDLIIPYQFAQQRKEPRGHRMWYLSQQDRTSPYYNGNFFDLLVSYTDSRTKRIKYKLSNEAIKFFLRYENKISKNESIF